MHHSDPPEEGTQDFNDEFDAITSADRDLYAMSFITTDDPNQVPDIDLLTHDDEDDLTSAASASAEPVPAVPALVDDSVAPARSSGRVRVIPGWVARPRVLAPWLASRVLDGLAIGGFHLVRAPWYVVRGTGVVVRGVARWVARPEDAEAYRAELSAARGQQAKNEVRRLRMGGQMRRALLPAAAGGMVWMWVDFGQWGILPAAVCSVTAAGLFTVGLLQGRKADPSKGRVAGGPRRKRPRVTSPLIMQALEDAGFGPVKVRQGDQVVEQGAEILSANPESGGTLFRIVLPRGGTAAGLMRKLDEFAGSLMRPAECVVIEPLPDQSPRHVELFIASKTLAERGAPAWKWADGKARPSAFFDGVPIGVDARGEDVIVPLENGIVGGAKGMGKSYTMRLLGMGAALCPWVILLIHNLKGGADYRCFAPVAHTLRSGSSLADVQALADDLAWLQAEIERRGKILANLPLHEVEEGKITPKLAQREGLRPIVMLIDEVQRAMQHPKLGDLIKARLDDVERTGRAVGIVIELATQSVKDGVLPAAVIGQSGRRIVHGVANVQDANTLGGEGTHGKGGRAIELNTPGLAYVGEAGGTLTLTAVAKVDIPEAAKIMEKARMLREKAGTLSGMAAGVVPVDEHDGGDAAFLADVLAVWPADDRGRPYQNAGSAELAELLAARPDGEYDGVTGPDVTRRMKALGVKTGSQRLKGRRDAQGVRRADVERAASASG